MTDSKIHMCEIATEQLVSGKFQPRQHFDEKQLEELAKTIESTNGLLQPIVVRPISDQKYEIIAGERRWRAAMLAGFNNVSCIIKNYSDEQALEAAIIENISRADLNPIEEASAYQRLMDEFGYIHEEIAASVGKSRTKITNSLRMLKLDPRVQELLIAGELTEGHGKILAGLQKEQQYVLALKCVKNEWSVRRIEQEVKQLLDRSEITTGGKDPNIKALERALSEYIGCQVGIDFIDQHGKLQINFHNLEILEGLFAKMGFKFK
jgi:ParB family transcriptional regulator, chromosome partitioning protein